MACHSWYAIEYAKLLIYLFAPLANQDIQEALSKLEQPLAGRVFALTEGF